MGWAAIIWIRHGRGLVLAGSGLLALLLTTPSGAETIAHHSIRARLDPPRARLEVTDQLNLRPGAAGKSGQEIHLLLHRALEVKSALLPVADATWQVFPTVDPVFFTPHPDSTELELMDRCQEIVLFPPPDTGWPREFSITLTYAGVLYDSLRAPRVAHARGFPTSTGLIDTAGAYLAGSSVWIPSELVDLFTFEVEVDLPSTWRAVSQGDITRTEREGGRLREQWTSREPMQEAFLVAGPYQVERQVAGGVEIFTYLYQPDPDISTRYLEATRRYLDRYARLFGPYPYRKFALVENFWQTGYGMPSFTLLGDRVIRLPFIIDTSYGHEILHNWWGNGVFVDPRRGNWCEGLTTYGADYAYQEEASPAEARDYRRSILVDYRNYVREATDFALDKFTSRTSPATQNVGYGKSMMVFHMLRRQLGDEIFGDALRRFYRTNLFRPVGWEELLQAFQEASGQDLTWFADQWVRRAGAPRLGLEEARVTALPQGYRVEATLTQAAPAYRLRVPVVVSGQSEESMVVVPVDGERTPLKVDVSWKPEQLSVDPDFGCFRYVDRGEIPATLSQTLGADSILIILPRQGSEELRQTFRELADGWKTEEKPVRIVTDGDLEGSQLKGYGIWLLGESSLGREFLEGLPAGIRLARDAWDLGGVSFPAAGHSLVMTAVRRENPEFSWTWLRSDDPVAVREIWRKLPHYGKYTYLVFEGGRNVGKGILEPETSPLAILFP